MHCAPGRRRFAVTYPLNSPASCDWQELRARGHPVFIPVAHGKMQQDPSQNLPTLQGKVRASESLQIHFEPWAYGRTSGTGFWVSGSGRVNIPISPAA